MDTYLQFQVHEYVPLDQDPELSIHQGNDQNPRKGWKCPAYSCLNFFLEFRVHPQSQAELRTQEWASGVSQ